MPERKIYKLSDGTEAKSIDAAARERLHGASLTWVVHPSLGPIAIGDDKLSPVTPPLPAEPANGTVLSDGFNAVIRCDDANDPDEGAWFMTGDKQTWCWDEVAPTITPDYRRYVPDPAAYSPGHSSWTDGDGDDIEIQQSAGFPDIPAYIVGSVNGVRLTAGQCEEFAAALWRLARRARESAALRAVRDATGSDLGGVSPVAAADTNHKGEINNG